MTVLEKIKRCVSLVLGFQEYCGEEEIEDFCSNELHTYPQHNEIMEYFKRIEALEKENAELKKKVENLQKYLDTRNCYRECAETWLKLTEAKKLLKQFLEAKNGEDTYKAEWEAEQFLKDNEVEK